MITLSLEGKVALVTGAGAGIGAAIATTLAEAGAAVVVNDIDLARAQETVAAIEVAGGQARAVQADVTSEHAVAVLLDATLDAYGQLDIAINNVGMMAGLGPLPLAQTDAAYVETLVSQNLIASTLCCAAEARVIADGGVIVNVTSGETMRAAPQLSVYAACKAAINHLVRSLALELGPRGIRVLAVAPGTTATEAVRAAVSEEQLAAIAASTPLQRTCVPQDLADLVLLMVSDRASMVTGQLVLADAGAHLSLNRAQW